MAIMTVTGLDEWLDALKLTERQTERLLRRSLYPGAKIVADECRKRIDALKVDNTLFAWNPHRNGITGGWKKALQESMGLAHMRPTHDGWELKLGFDGYSDIEQNRGYVNGKKITTYNSNNNPSHRIPNAVIARTTEKGSSNLPAQPFMSQTILATQVEAEQVMGKYFVDEFVNVINSRSR